MRFCKFFLATLTLGLMTGRAGATFNNIKGWHYASVWCDGISGHECTVPDTDINGEVGHTLTVGGPTANCQPGGNWTLNVTITSGKLPPGMTLNTSNESISGIPTERGHYIVTLHADNLTCNGSSYMGFSHRLLFHITGSGQVIQ